ncbi:hypothetical protein RYX36_016589 [Vicia faba]
MIQIFVVIRVLECFFCCCYIVFGSYGFCFGLWPIMSSAIVATPDDAPSTKDSNSCVANSDSACCSGAQKEMK